MEKNSNYLPKILIIEDEIDIRETLAEVLQLHGYQVILASSGKIGLVEATLHQPDLILCDVMMPGLDGFQTVEKIRQNPNLALVPIIFLTARTDHRDHRMGMVAGADDYLYKPFKIEELVHSIRSRMERALQVKEQNQASIEKLKAKLAKHQACLDEYSRMNSHVLRAPIARLISLIQVLLEEEEGGEPLSRSEVLESIADTALEIDDVIYNINDMLSGEASLGN